MAGFPDKPAFISKKGYGIIRHIRAVIWLSVLVVLLSACSVGEDPDGSSNADSSGADSPGNVLRIDVDYDFGPFNPHRVDASGSTYVFPFIYSFLFVPDPDGTLEPDLAVAWAYDPQTFTWRIDLRKDARFHNGDPVTAADVVFSIQSFMESKVRGIREVIKKQTCSDEKVLYRLVAAGLMKELPDKKCAIRCGLYENYFRKTLNA